MSKFDKFDKPYRVQPEYDIKKINDLFNKVSKLDTHELLQYSLINQLSLNVINNTSITGNLYLTESAILRSTLNVTDNVSLLNTLTVTNNTSLLAKLQVTDHAKFMNGINVYTNTSLFGKLNATESTTLQSTLNVSDNASFLNGINVTNNTLLNNDLNVIGTTNLNTLIAGSSTFNSLASFPQGINVLNGLNAANGITSDRLYVIGNTSVDGRLFASTLVYGSLQNISGYNTFNGPAINLDDYSEIDTDGNTFIKNGTATFAGTGTTSISNSLRVNSQSIEIIGKGSTNGIQYSGPFNVSTTGEILNNFSYVGPFNVSTSGINNRMNYGGDIILSGDLRIKSGYNLYIEGTNTITTIDTKTLVSDVLEIKNVGTGPALILNQVDTLGNDIACFQDDDNNVIIFGSNGNTTIKGGLKVGYTPTPSSFNSISGSTLDINGTCAISENLLLAGNVISQSDRRIKTNIKPIYNCLEKINTISGYEYNRIDLDNEKHIGLIAQEVEELFPELVTESNNIKGINYQGFIAVLLNCIKELNKKIENLETLDKT